MKSIISHIEINVLAYTVAIRFYDLILFPTEEKSVYKEGSRIKFPIHA